jgi:hypothetical protein
VEVRTRETFYEVVVFPLQPPCIFLSHSVKSEMKEKDEMESLFDVVLQFV